MITTNSDGQTISQAFITAMGQPSISYSMKLMEGGADVGAIIKRAHLDLGAVDVDADTSTFRPGEVLATQFRAELWDAPSLLGDELEVRVGVEVSQGTYEYVTVAYVTITSESVWAGVSEVKGVGRTALLAAPLGLSAGDYSPSALCTAIATATGLTITLGAFTETPDVTVTATSTCREAMEALCARLGGFACEIGGGISVLPYDATPTYTLPQGVVVGRPDMRGAYEVDGLTVHADGSDFTYGTGRVEVSDATATATTSALTWANLDGYEYDPGELTVALLDPRLTPADVASVTLGNDSYVLPTRGIAAHFDGGWYGTISARGMSAEAEEALVEGPLSKAVGIAATIAEQARAVANAIGQHVWADTNGVHVTEAEGDPTTEHNILINSLGILLRHAVNPLVSITQSAIAFYDGLGDAAANVVAQFGADGARIGKAASYNLALAAQRIALMLGDDSLVDLSTNGITTTLKFAGSTQAAGTNYTDAELEAIESFLNDGTTTVVGNKVYHDGEDTGYTVRAISSIYYEVLDAQGDSFSSANYDVMLYEPAATPQFSLDSAFSPSTEIPGAPVVMELGGVALTFQDKSLKMSPPLPVASGGTGIADFGTVVSNDISTAVSVSTGTNKSIGSIVLTKGTWLIRYCAKFDSNATGRRQAVLDTTPDRIAATWQRCCGSETMAVTGGATILNGTMIRTVTSSETIYLTVFQSSGGALDVTGNLQAIKLG